MVPLKRQKSRGRSSSVPGTPPPPPPPPQSAGLRTKWRKLSLGARNVFCIRAQSRAYEDCNDGSDDVLHIRPGGDLSWTSSPRDHRPAPPSSTPPPDGAQHTPAAEKAAGNEAKEAANKLTTQSTEDTTRSEAAASHNSPFINAKGAHGPGDASPLCDHASFLYFDGGSPEHHQVATTGDIGALIDALFQIGEWDSVLSPGPLTPFTIADDADSDKTMKQEDVGGVRKEGGCAWECCGAKEDADVTTDAQQAWEAMKRRVLHIEEHGALPDDWEDNEAAAAAAWGVYRDAEAELASREQRARRRKGWAQDALTHCHAGQQPRRRRASTKKKDSKATKTTTTPTTPAAKKAKKGRRHGGCWIREKDGVFLRLVRFQLAFFSRRVVKRCIADLPPPPPFSTVRASSVRVWAHWVGSKPSNEHWAWQQATGPSI